MKKLLFTLIAALFSVALTSCSWFDSAPIEPNIIGTGIVHYEPQSDTWFVEVDSIHFTITRVAARGGDSYSYIDPVEGMQVTVFTTYDETGIQAVTGIKNVQEIEDVYHENYTGEVFCVTILILGAILFFKS